ncbi:MAG TPA: hypothetical protein VML55_00355, partial [Planctomycetaceae bacterium]|nr:hypothetical protein [Planctomycetaceae bacterium]
GKSSLVKAGLLPRLAEDVLAVYVEATPDETEPRIVRGLRKHLPDLPDDLGLVEIFARLRRGAGGKVVVVLDQFEQWLHAHRAERDAALVAALRQCDGGRLHAIVMVRDDFAMAAARFMDALDVPIVQGRNFATVDLFDVPHAAKILTRFGQAFGTLPPPPGRPSDEQQRFVEAAAAELADDGQVVCVRLALFAEMLKGRPWAPATLAEAGGAEGIGVRFLEETFFGRSANPRHRLHQQAAREVLKSLLPEVGSDIKGHMRSHGDLQDAAGYQDRPGEFNGLLRALDGELRLITPTDPEGFRTDSDSDPAAKHYQLTHDYLVPALREWLTRKQRETRRGRAELKLAERAGLWNARPENRHLPSLWEWTRIRALTHARKWTPPERRIMRKAGRVHGVRSALALLVILLIGLGTAGSRSAVLDEQARFRAQKQEEQDAAEASRLVQGLLNAETSNVAAIVEQLQPYRRWADPELVQAFDEAPADSSARLHAGLALLRTGAADVQYVGRRLLDVTPLQFPHVRDLLAGRKAELIDGYWTIVADARQDAARRFQAACALATYDAESLHWQDSDLVRLVAGHLVSVQPSDLAPWRDALRPVRERLVEPLAAIYRDPARGEQARSFATDVLGEYLRHDADGLFDLVADADERLFQPLFARLSAHAARAIELAEAEISRSPVFEWRDEPLDPAWTTLDYPVDHAVRKIEN